MAGIAILIRVQWQAEKSGTGSRKSSRGDKSVPPLANHRIHGTTKKHVSRGGRKPASPSC